MDRCLVKGFVTVADGKIVRVELHDSSLKDELSNLGFSYDHDVSEYVMHTDDNIIKASIFERLRDLDVGFSAGREWCPSEVFEYFRETGLLSGQYKRMSWSGPEDCHVTLE